VFKFILFAFYTFIISHHICCFSVHSSTKLFAQSLVFDVSEFSLIHLSIFTSKQLKNINITLFTHQNNYLNFTFACTSTINKDIKKTKNSKFFTLHLSVFYKSKLISYLILSESYKQKHHTTLKVLIFLTSHLTKWHSNNIKKTLHHIKTFTKHQNHIYIIIFHSQNTTFSIFQTTFQIF